jgi:hypothetical protein
MAADYSILDDLFEVTKKDPDGKKFDRGAPLCPAGKNCMS